MLVRGWQKKTRFLGFSPVPGLLSRPGFEHGLLGSPRLSPTAESLIGSGVRKPSSRDKNYWMLLGRFDAEGIVLCHDQFPPPENYNKISARLKCRSRDIFSISPPRPVSCSSRPRPFRGLGRRGKWRNKLCRLQKTMP